MARRPGGDVAIRSRLAASPGLNDAEAHTLAGLLDAESSLAIVRNNGGADCGHSSSAWSAGLRVTAALGRRSGHQLRVHFDRLHGRQGLRYRAAFLRRLGVLLELVVVDSGY
jgi:hypothetical protein